MRVQHARAAVAINVAPQAVPEHDAQRRYSVPSADLLAFLISAAAVADGDFVQGNAALGEFDGDSGSKPNPLLRNGIERTNDRRKAL